MWHGTQPRFGSTTLEALEQAAFKHFETYRHNTPSLNEQLIIALKAGARPDATDNKGKTFLMYAAQGGHLPVVMTLLEYGADGSLKDKAQKTALILTKEARQHLSDSSGHFRKIIDILEKVQRAPHYYRSQAFILESSRNRAERIATYPPVPPPPPPAPKPELAVQEAVSIQPVEAPSPEPPAEMTYTLPQKVFRNFKDGLSIKDAADDLEAMLSFLRDPDELEYFAFQVSNLLDVAQSQEDKDKIAIHLGEYYFHARGEEAVFFDRVSQQVFKKPIRSLAKDYPALQYYLDVTSFNTQVETPSTPQNKSRGMAAIAGMKALKADLEEKVIFPLRYAMSSEAEELNRKVHKPNGLLFYGPPGCGKTYVAAKLAEELGMPFYEVSYDDVVSPYHGMTIKNMRKVFKKALNTAPSILVINEIDDFTGDRSGAGGSQQHVVSEVNHMLRSLDSLGEKGVLVIGTTNHFDKMDSAIKRAKRFDIKIEIPPPDEEMRIALFQQYLDNPTQDGQPFSEAAFKALAEQTEMYAAADIELICKNASNAALRAGHPEEIPADFILKAVEGVKSSLMDEVGLEELLKLAEEIPNVNSVSSPVPNEEEPTTP